MDGQDEQDKGAFAEKTHSLSGDCGKSITHRLYVTMPEDISVTMFRLRYGKYCGLTNPSPGY